MSDPVIYPQFSADGLPITYVPNPYSADGKPVDSQWKQPVRVHTTGNITLSGLQIIDAISVMEGDRVLVKDQVNPAENGIWISSAGTWRRANDMYLWEQFVGAVVAVEEGATTNDTIWLCQAPATGTPDVTPNNWIPVSAVAGTLGAYTPLRAIVTDALGNPQASPTTAQEIAFVSGVTSSVQQQFNALDNKASSAFSIAVDGTNAAAGAQSTANTALSTANSAYALAQTGTNSIAAAVSTANTAYALAQIGTNTGTAAYQLAQTGSNTAYDAYQIAVTGTTIGSLAYGLATSLGNKYVRTTRFASIGAGTGGAVALPANSTVVLDDFGGGVDAVITTISAGYPTFQHAFTAAGDLVTTSFDAGGNYTLSGAPSAYPVALIYRVRQKLSDFDSTSTDIIGEYDVESVDFVAGTPNQVYVNGSTTAQFGSITLSLPQDIAPTSTPTFAGLTSTGSVYSPNIDQTTQVAYSGSNVAWAAYELAVIGTNAVVGTAAYDIALAAYALAQIGTNTGTAALAAAASAQSTADTAYFIAQVGTNTGTAAYTLAESGSNVAWAAWVLANAGTDLPQSSYDLALAAYHLAQIGTNTGTAALEAAGTAYSVANSAYSIAVDGTNAAASAQSTADSAYFIAQIGTNTGSAAYNIAVSGSNLAVSAYELAVICGNVAFDAWELAQIGTNTGTAAYQLAQSGSNLASAAYALASYGTDVSNVLSILIGSIIVDLAATGTVANSALAAAASAQSTADTAYFIAQVGTNTGTAAYTLAESGSNVAWSAWILANAGTELPQSSYDLALAAYHLAQIGTNTGTAAYQLAESGSNYAAAAYALAEGGTNAAATAQSTADTAYFIAQVGTNTGTAAYTLAESGSNVAWSAWTLANAGTELPQSSYDLALAAYHLAQIGTNTGTAALGAAATAQSTADFAYYLAQVGTNTGTAAYQLAESGSNLASAAYALAQLGTLASGVTSIVGTQNQVLANGAFAVNTTGTVTLTTPQNIAPTSAVTFGSVFASGSVFTPQAGITEADVGHIHFALSSGTLPRQTGCLRWNALSATLDLDMAGTSVTLQLGQETLLYARNNTGTAIPNGSVVYVSGAISDTPTIALASAATRAQSRGTVGLATEDIAAGATGYVCTQGLVRDFDTSAFTEGRPLFLSTTAGQMTMTPPTQPNSTVFVGICIKKSVGQGVVWVDVRPTDALNELQDVYVPARLVGDHLVYNGTLWVNEAGTASSAYSYAQSAYQLAQVGTNTGTAAYNLAQSAYSLASTNSPLFSFQTITSGTAFPLSAGRKVFLADSSSGAVVLALPNATGWTGQMIHVKKVSTDGNTVTVRSSTGTATIDGSLNQSFTAPYMSLQMTTDGTNWYIL